jgi:hypothetical protein
VSGDLELLRAFGAENAVVEAGSRERARAALLEHIDASVKGNRRARRRRPRRRIAVRGIRADLVALAVSIFVVVGVAAALLSAGGKRSHRPAHQAVVGPTGRQVIRNFAPRGAPALPGQVVCTAELTRPAVATGGVFYVTTCQFQPPGAGGSPDGTLRESAGKVNGVDEHAFSITASGLRPNTGGSAYAVWLVRAATVAGAGYRLLQPHRPQLLGVIEPGVGRDGKLAAQGLVPPDLLGSDYLLMITLEPHGSATTPGPTVLRGFVSL